MNRIRFVFGTALMFGWGTLATAGFGFEFGNAPAACKPVKACAPVGASNPITAGLQAGGQGVRAGRPAAPGLQAGESGLRRGFMRAPPVKTCEPVHKHVAALHGHLVALLHPTWLKGHAWKHGVVEEGYTAPQPSTAPAEPAPAPIAPNPPTPGKA